jgi:hypothetical protein
MKTRNAGLGILLVSIVMSCTMLMTGSFCFGQEKKAATPVESCLANLKTLNGALELYVLENNSVDYGKLKVSDLVEQGYLKKKPICEEDGEYTFRKASGGDYDFEVSCTVHGNVKACEKLRYDSKIQTAEPLPACANNLSELDIAVSKYEERFPLKLISEEALAPFLVKEGLADFELKCPAGGVYSAKREKDPLTDVEKPIARCSIHGDRIHAGANVYDEQLSKRNPEVSCQSQQVRLSTALMKYVGASRDSGKTQENRGDGDDQGTREIDQKTLVAGKFLEKEFVCPSGGSYTLKIVDGFPEVTCTVHKGL